MATSSMGIIFLWAAVSRGVCIMRSMRAAWLCLTAAMAVSAAPRFDDAISAGSRMPRLHSLLASQHGELILERYYNGARADGYANIKSASKSVISALVGIAIDRKLLPGVDATIEPYLPDLPVSSMHAR